MMNIIRKLGARHGNPWDNAPVLMAFLGDSVTHGCFEVFRNGHGQIDTVYHVESGYPGMLRRRLNAYFPAAGLSTLNAGISGDSAPGGLRRLERDVLRFKPDLVVVNFALNDSMGGMEKLPVYQSAMRAIFERLQAEGIECVLLTPNMMCRYVDTALQDGMLRDVAKQAAAVQNDGVLTAYVDAARAIARELNVPIADAYAVWQKLDADGADTTAMLSNHINHPTVEMHEIFARVLEEILL